jgi:tRNA modification GTPase
MVSHGVIADREQIIDEVVVGCESEGTFVIHCHGNPLLVERIVKLLQSHGAVLTDAESFAEKQLRSGSKTVIETEAKLAMQKSATRLGVKILQAQINGGLSTWTQYCMDHLKTMNPEELKKQCHQILHRSKIAKQVIEGVRIVIAGPPNSGKSTLLNCLAGQQQVVVSDTAGTTRDWVNVTCQLGPLKAEFIDTAGLDEALASTSSVEQAAQEVTQDLLASCDLLLYVVSVDNHPLPAVCHCAAPVIYVYNKCDLLPEHKNTETQGGKGICISAKENKGIDGLIREILGVLQINTICPDDPIVFTERQSTLANTLLHAPSQDLTGLLHELLSAVSA